jgi:hypothetical protein
MTISKSKSKPWAKGLALAVEARRSPKPLTRITIDIYTEQFEKLETMVEQFKSVKKTSKSELIREAIDEYIKKPFIV